MNLLDDPSAAPPAPKRLHIPSLDGLRTFSILVVFLGHAGAGELVPGGFGVTVFFVVSGYLITTLMRMEFDRSDTVDIRGFYQRRAFRILPLFYFVLFALIFLTLVFGLGRGTVDVTATLAQAFHVSNYWSILQLTRGWGRPVMDGAGIFWSLAVEEHFYLAFPLLFKAMNTRRWTAALQGQFLAGLCGVVLAWRTILVYVLDATEERTYYATDTRIDSILIGCIVAIVANPVLDRREAPQVVLRRAVTAAVAILLTFAVRDPSLRESVRYSIQSVGIAFVMIYVVAAPTSLAGRILNKPVIAWFGRLSYAFYLVHLVVLKELAKHYSTITTAVLAFIISTLLSIVLQRLVERPGLALRSKWTSRHDRRDAAVLVHDR